MSGLDLDLRPEPPEEPGRRRDAVVRHRRPWLGVPEGPAGREPRPVDDRARDEGVGADRPGTKIDRAGVQPCRAGDGRPVRPGFRPDAAPGSIAADCGMLHLQLEDALVIPAGSLVRGGIRTRSLLLGGDIVGNVQCGRGPVVIRAGATLRGRLVAGGDVYVSGTVTDGGGGVVIVARGRLVLAPGARVEGDVRSGRLELHEGAALQGIARACEG